MLQQTRFIGNDYLRTNKASFIFKKNTPFLDIFNKVIDGFNEGGFQVYLSKQFNLHVQREKEEKENVTLTLQHFQGPFLLLFLRLLLSFAVFIGELIIGKYGSVIFHK